MNKDRLYDRVHRELTRGKIGSAPETFYEEVWRRIRNQERKPVTVWNKKRPGAPFGVVCWKSVPVFGVFLLAASLLLWNSTPDTNGRTLNAAESYVLDSGEMPTNSDLLYQILFPSNEAGLEKNP